jgi:hypothetical protein
MRSYSKFVYNINNYTSEEHDGCVRVRASPKCGCLKFLKQCPKASASNHVTTSSPFNVYIINK